MNAVILAITPYIVPLIIIVAGWFIHHFSTYLPAQQRAYISMLADMAVRMIEQQFSGYTDAQKQTAALESLKGLFKAFGLPLPDDAILSGIIAAAFHALENPPVNPLQGKK